MSDREARSTVQAEVNVRTKREDAQLVEAAQRGDRRSREALVAAHLPMVRAVASRYRKLGLSDDDLVQEGSVGLIEAIDRYDRARSDDFEAYARFRIRRAIRKALTEQSRLVRLPKHIVERRRAVERAEAAIQSATGHVPDPEEVARATGLTPSAVASVRTIGASPLSLDQPICDDGSTLEAVVRDELAENPEAATVRHEQTVSVDDAVAALPPRQREVVVRHFGLGHAPEQMAEIARALHVSQQRARAIERDALYALRDRLEADVTRRRAG
jgi:RNA polymerase sigma factor (sigma-70 family)